MLLSGDLGRHGMAVMSVREGLAFDSPIQSDCAALWEPVSALLQAGVDVHCLRDLTRGGLAAGLNEIAVSAGVRIDLREDAVPVTDLVRGGCELLGLDPFYVANEGRFVALVQGSHADRALEALRGSPISTGAVRIGTVADGSAGLVTLRSRIGSQRILDRLSGEQLPRIC